MAVKTQAAAVRRLEAVMSALAAVVVAAPPAGVVVAGAAAEAVVAAVTSARQFAVVAVVAAAVAAVAGMQPGEGLAAAGPVPATTNILYNLLLLYTLFLLLYLLHTCQKQVKIIQLYIL